MGYVEGAGAIRQLRRAGSFLSRAHCAAERVASDMQTVNVWIFILHVCPSVTSEVYSLVPRR